MNPQKIAYKKLVLEKAKEKQQALIKDFRTRIKHIMQSEFQTNKAGINLARQALEDAGKEEVNILADQLNFAVEEMDLLNKIKVEEPLHQQAQFGSIVETENQTIFVSVSLEEFEVNGRTIFGMSTKAPSYNDLLGKKAGQQFLGCAVLDVF